MASGTIATGIDVRGATADGGLEFSNLVPQIFEKFLAVLVALAIVGGSLFLIRLLRGKLKKVETAHLEQRTALELLEKIVTGFIVMMTVTVALKTVGIDMTLLVSVAVLGLSYGLQDIIKNYVAGILILFKAPFKLGDIVKIKDYTGKVTKMDFQATALETFDNRHVTIYNSDVMAQSIVNYSKNNLRRLELDVTIGYGSDATRALQVFQTILSSSPSVLQSPSSSVVFKKFLDIGTVFTLKFWVKRPCNILGIRTEIAAQIHCSFDDAQIFMPYYKGIEVGDETGLGKTGQDHVDRVKAFYADPKFVAVVPAVVVATVAVPEALPGVVDESVEHFGFEEPEA